MIATHQAHPAMGHATHGALDELHALQQLAGEDSAFAESLRLTGSTQEASLLAERWGIHISAEALWRNRGRHGLPTWRG
jgi:hypothetical protein